jgi:hypothetical protein
VTGRHLRALALATAFVAGAASPAFAHDAPRRDSAGHTAKLGALRAATAAFGQGPGGGWTTRVVDLAGISCIEDPHGTGAMGVHYVDPANLLDGQVSQLAPEALIYEPRTDGSMTLVAAEYLVLADAWDAGHRAPPILYGHRFERVEAGNRYGLPAFYELHVWHVKPNPNGTFDDWNPTVHCS